MYRLVVFTAVLGFITSSARGQEVDMIKAATLVPGTVKEVKRFEVVVTTQSGESRKFPVHEIEWIRFAGEPRDLTEGRTNITRGAFEDALDSLGKVKPADVTRPEAQQDLQFYQALATARLALAGKGELAGPAKLMAAFISGQPNSFHYLEANEVQGDLLTAAGQFAAAEKHYAEVAKAESPAFKMRALIALGRSQLAQNKFREAYQEFDNALKITGAKDSEVQVMLATLGKAEALAAGGKVDEAIKMIEGVIAQAPASAQEVYARAYNSLGSAYKKAGKPKEALLAYLHVPVLFSAYPESHAEALANLRTLWLEVDEADRAREASELLEQRYPNSRWVTAQSR